MVIDNKALYAKLERIENKLSALNSAAKAPLWVKASVVTKKTGWDSNGMRTARERGYILFKKKDGLYDYDLNSLHQSFYL